MLPNWLVLTNEDLGTFDERSSIDIPLPLETTDGITTSHIAGELPPGIVLIDNTLTGVPFEVLRTIEFKFVIRAESSEGLLDRTFRMTIEGPDSPRWVTPEGRLPVGPNGVLFILDSSIIDYQLLATDNDLPAGDSLEYFIQDGDGELPPGITLTSDGRITGVVDPILALDQDWVDPGYDIAIFDRAPFDFSVPSAGGLDTFYYDMTVYDFSIPTQTPKKLNRMYEFLVTVADRTDTIKRRFQIYVVGDDFARADNTIMKAADGIYVADMTYLRTPLWLTPADLGVRRANNYVTIFLDTLDQNTTPGVILYQEAPFNDDNTPSEFPPGLVLDGQTGELAGIVPYQPAITKEYKFTIIATRYNTEQGTVSVFGTVNADILSGNTNIRIGKLPDSLVDNIDDISILIGSQIPLQNKYYTITEIITTNEDYDEIVFEEPLDPILGREVLNVEKLAPIAQDYLLVSALPDSDREWYTTKSLEFSSTEVYVIQDVFPYINYRVTIEDSASAIELNTEITGTDGGPTVEGILENFLGIDSTRPAYVSTVSGGFGIIDIDLLIPATSLTYQSSYIAGLFHTSDSAEIFVERLSTPDHVKLNTALTSSFGAGQQISLGTVVGDFFKKTFPRAEVDLIEKPKTFTIKILGEVDSTITWLTDPLLPKIKANRISTLFVKAETTIPDALLKYQLISGSLPSGLELKDNGEIVGKIPVYGTNDLPGLTVFDNSQLTFDNELTTIDREFKFTVIARDRFGFSAITREFTICIDDEDRLNYSNIFVKPLLKSAQKDSFISLMDNSEIIPPELVYRPNDASFGIQKQLKALVYAGIESKDISEFVAATTQNHKRKSYYLGDVKVAVAKVEGTNDIIYEVVYLEIIDPAKPTEGMTRKVFNHANTNGSITVDSVKLEALQDQFVNEDEPQRLRPNWETVTIDNNSVQVSQSTDSRKYITNIDNMRENIQLSGNNSRDFLPLWMRTPQDDSLADLDYVFAIPLVYVLPGNGDSVKNKIVNSDFDFKTIDYDIDRYIIDATTGNPNEQYIVFGNYQYNV